MTRKKKYREPKAPSRKLYFERPYGIKLENLLDIYLHVIGNMDAEMDMKIDKITINLSANKHDLERVISELQTLQGQLLKATIPDENTNYHYEQALFKHIFKHQIHTKFLHQVLVANNYNSELTESKTLITNAPIKVLEKLQEIGYQSIQNSPHEYHKDIQRFLSIINMKTGKSHNEILELALANSLLFEKDGNVHFSGEKDKTYDQIMEIIETFSVSTLSKESVYESNIDEDLSSFGFDGGKIVFVNASDRSTYEDQENLEKRKGDK